MIFIGFFIFGLVLAVYIYLSCYLYIRLIRILKAKSKAQHAEYQNVIESFSMGLLIADKAGKIKYINKEIKCFIDI